MRYLFAVLLALGFSMCSMNCVNNDEIVSDEEQSADSPHSQEAPSGKNEQYSRKVFVGGLPPDIDEGKGISFYFNEYLFFLVFIF